MTDNKSTFEIETKAQLGALESAMDSIQEISDSLDDLVKMEKESAKGADKAADALDDMEKESKGLKRSLGGLIGMGVGGFFTALAGTITGGVFAANNYIDQVDRMSDRMAISSEEASVLAVSLGRVGSSADEAEPAFSSFQGRLIDELEAQKNIAKEVASIEKDRQEVLKDLGEMEADHLATLSDLEAERASIGSDGVAERIAQRDQELASISSDYARTMDELRDQEKKENERYAEIWRDRVKEYERNALKLREDFEDKGPFSP